MTSYIPSLTLPSQVFAQPAVSILLPIVCGVGVGYSVRPSETQKTYRELKQPPGRPPARVFGPVWTLLYGLMGYSAHRAWNTGVMANDAMTFNLAKQGATLYTIQLGLNLVWMPLFFGLKRPVEASVDIVALTSVTAYLTYIWSKVDTWAAWGMAPYLGWLSFATYLSIGAGILNDWDFKSNETKKGPSDRSNDTNMIHKGNKSK